ncbi:MAG: DUF2057 domain-containing protein [Lentisphaeraceae bacterium]|nr:DUF2057 domain-containing protein [Lentisphaeraceae bacterium]
MRLVLVSLLFLVVTSCGTSVVKMTDKFEGKAYIEVPYQVNAIEVNGRLVKSSLVHDAFTIEIPVGRTEFVFRYHNIFFDNTDNDHEGVQSDKMTAVFVAEEGQHYSVICPNPLMLDEAKALMPNLTSHLLHKETGEVIKAVNGHIPERFHGVKSAMPYEELKHWWVKSTNEEKNSFLKWSEAQ